MRPSGSSLTRGCASEPSGRSLIGAEGRACTNWCADIAKGFAGIQSRPSANILARELPLADVNLGKLGRSDGAVRCEATRSLDFLSAFGQLLEEDLQGFWITLNKTVAVVRISHKLPIAPLRNPSIQ
jgi:hypothetical protein